MNDTINPNDILIALAHLQDELPALVGEEKWNAIKSTFEARVAQLQQTSDAAERERLSQDLLDMLAVSEGASKRLSNEILSVIALRSTMQDIEPLVNAMGLDPNAISSSMEIALRTMSAEVEKLSAEDQPCHRYIVIRVGGNDDAMSISIRHLKLGFGEMIELIGGAIMSGSDIYANPNPLIVVAGVLLTIRSLTKAMTVKISEIEASVFWGFILARDEENTATQAKIFEETNGRRKRINLEPLTDTQVRQALNKLRRMKSVQKVGDQHWKLVESFTVRG